MRSAEGRLRLAQSRSCAAARTLGPEPLTSSARIGLILRPKAPDRTAGTQATRCSRSSNTRRPAPVRLEPPRHRFRRLWIDARCLLEAPRQRLHRRCGYPRRGSRRGGVSVLDASPVCNHSHDLPFFILSTSCDPWGHLTGRTRMTSRLAPASIGCPEAAKSRLLHATPNVRFDWSCIWLHDAACRCRVEAGCRRGRSTT